MDRKGPISLKNQAYFVTKTAILSLDLRPGHPLAERDLAEQLGSRKTNADGCLTIGFNSEV